MGAKTKVLQLQFWSVYTGVYLCACGHLGTACSEYEQKAHKVSLLLLALLLPSSSACCDSNGWQRL